MDEIALAQLPIAEVVLKEQAIAKAEDLRAGPLPRAMRRETLRGLLIGFTIAMDALAIVVGFEVVEVARGFHWLSPGGISLVVIVIPAYIYFGIIGSAFASPTLSRVSASVTGAWRALLGALVVVIVCAFFAKFSLKISRSAFIYAILSASSLLVASRGVTALVIRWGLRGKTTDRLLITDRTAQGVPPDIDVLDLQFSSLRPDLADPAQMALISERIDPYDLVYLHCGEAEREGWVTTLKASGKACEIVVPSQSIHTAVGVGRLGGNDTLILSRGPLSLGSRIQKRLFDLAVAVPVLILVGPLMLIVAALIRLESPGPALFTQSRIGQANRPFRIYKSRSMRLASQDEQGTRSAARDDDRITRVGRFIRRTSIDELPQLLNVLLGEMSLVGPRPHATGSRAGEQLFWEVSELYWMRHALKPGMTGLAQIHGYRGATQTKSDLEARLRYDLEYLQSWSLWNDLTILFATVKVVSHANAY